MSRLRIIAIILSIVYIAVLLKMIVFKYPPAVVTFSEANLIPFKTILTYLSGYPTWVVAKNNLIGNIVPFVPLGFLIAFIPKKPLKGLVVAGVSLGIGTVIEGTQLVFQTGVFDVDDILLNALGVAIGYLITATIINFIKKNNVDNAPQDT